MDSLLEGRFVMVIETKVVSARSLSLFIICWMYIVVKFVVTLMNQLISS